MLLTACMGVSSCWAEADKSFTLHTTYLIHNLSQYATHSLSHLGKACEINEVKITGQCM